MEKRHFYFVRREISPKFLLNEVTKENINEQHGTVYKSNYCTAINAACAIQDPNLCYKLIKKFCGMGADCSFKGRNEMCYTYFPPVEEFLNWHSEDEELCLRVLPLLFKNGGSPAAAFTKKRFYEAKEPDKLFSLVLSAIKGTEEDIGILISAFGRFLNYRSIRETCQFWFRTVLSIPGFQEYLNTESEEYCLNSSKRKIREYLGKHPELL